MYDLVKRPEVKLAELSKFMTIDIDPTLFEQLEIEIKYEGYINKAERCIKMNKMSNLKLPQDIDYTKVANLALEAQSKLNQIRPKNFGMASRISGINPSDLEVIAIYLKGFRNGKLKMKIIWKVFGLEEVVIGSKYPMATELETLTDEITLRVKQLASQA